MKTKLAITVVVLCATVFWCWPLVGLAVLTGTGCFVAALVALFLRTWDKATKHVGVMPGDETADTGRCQLFSHLPELRGRVAWLDLGASFPTPVQAARLARDGRATATVWLKREDLSSPVYGGNKVRTLEHQLGCVLAAHRRRGREGLGGRARVYALGGPGSNQVTAAAVHMHVHGGGELEPCAWYPIPEGKSKENALNVLSTLSTSVAPARVLAVWHSVADAVRSVRALLFTGGEHFVLPPGGANVTGALGHVAAALELAAQVRAGLLPEPEHIVLPHGSGCTTSGLLLGIAVARQRGLGFARLRALHGVTIHPLVGAFGGVVPRKCVVDLVTDTADFLAANGVDVRADVAQLLRSHWRLHLGHAGGEYGVNSAQGEAACAAWRAGARVDKPPDQPDVWLDGTFGAKAMACLIDLLDAGDIDPAATTIFWATKSAVQPLASPLPQVFDKLAHCHHTVQQYCQAGGVVQPVDCHHSAISSI